MTQPTNPAWQQSFDHLKRWDSPAFIVKPYNTKELCCIYGVSPKTFFRWLRPFKPQIGKRNGRMYTVRQIEIIIGLIGVPYAYREKEMVA